MFLWDHIYLLCVISLYSKTFLYFNARLLQKLGRQFSSCKDVHQIITSAPSGPCNVAVSLSINVTCVLKAMSNKPDLMAFLNTAFVFGLESAEFITSVR